MIDFLTQFLLIAAAMGIGYFMGYHQHKTRSGRKTHDHQHVHVQEITIDDAIEIIEYLQARNRHPSNQRFRHPEMEEEDDC